MTGGNVLSCEVINMKVIDLPIVKEIVDACGIKLERGGKMDLGVQAYHQRIPQ